MHTRDPIVSSTAVKTRVVRSLKLFPEAGRGVVATLGNFDGLHSGHQSLVRQVVTEACTLGLPSVLISFYPHPAQVLGRASEIPILTSLHQRVQILSEWGVGVLFLKHFTPDFSQLSAADFIDGFLIRDLGVQKLIIGPDAAVGRMRQGTPEYIRERMETSGRAVEVISEIAQGGQKTGSRRIRDLILRGEVHSAALLLGRSYAIRGRTVRGAGRGRQIGIPTANIAIVRHVVPAAGVYCGYLEHAGKQWPGVVNIGVRPTFDNGERSVECHLLDYTGPDFYGDTVEFSFVSRIRDEIKFASVPELVARIGRDITEARQILSQTSVKPA